MTKKLTRLGVLAAAASLALLGACSDGGSDEAGADAPGAPAAGAGGGAETAPGGGSAGTMD